MAGLVSRRGSFIQGQDFQDNETIDMTDNEKLSVKEAYRAMVAFLEAYYDRGKSEEIAVLLSSLAAGPDGRPMDPAHWRDWLTAVEHVRLL